MMNGMNIEDILKRRAEGRVATEEETLYVGLTLRDIAQYFPEEYADVVRVVTEVWQKPLVAASPLANGVTCDPDEVVP